MYTGRAATHSSAKEEEKNAPLFDAAVPGDVRVEDEVIRLWQLKTSVKVILVVVEALGTILKKLEFYVEKGGIEVSLGLLQKVALLDPCGCWHPTKSSDLLLEESVYQVSTFGMLREVFGEKVAG